MSQNTGKKFDQNKPKIGDMMAHFSQALWKIAELDTYGADKYGADNLFKVENGYRRYTDAALRHFLLETVEETDKETGLHHAVAVAWNALARLEILLRTREDMHEGFR